MKIYTVSEIVREVKTGLEALYPDLWVEGEVSNLICHSSGHCYFSLKDAGAQLNVVFFRDEFARLRFRPENGLHVVVRGRLTLYPFQGKFQLVGSTMEPRGKGALQLAFEQLKAKLQKEGLFESERKKPIPSLPQWIGIVTSVDGAALQDILSVLNRRFANLRTLICPVRVQGEGAAQEIADMIQLLNRDYPTLDVLLVGRGGGSLEDLWAFNEEIVARAIGASKIPIISCVGHETDYTIADFVADVRAPTPSAAAELVIRAKTELLQHVDNLTSRLQSQIRYLLEGFAQRLTHVLTNRVLSQPLGWLDERRQECDDLRERLLKAARDGLEQRKKNLTHLLEKLNILSPLATLGRGYAIAWKLPERHIITRSTQVRAEESIEIQVHQGRVHAKVQRTEV